MSGFSPVGILICLLFLFLIGFVIFKIVMWITNNSSVSNKRVNELEQRVSKLEKK